MAYLDELMPQVDDPAIAQQLYPWLKRDSSLPLPPAAAASVAPMPAGRVPAQPLAVPATPPAPATAPLAAVPVGPSAAATPASTAPSAPMQPVSLGPQAQPLPPAAATLAVSKPPELHGWKKVLDVVGQTYMPRLEETIPGTPGNYRQQVRPLLEKQATEEARSQTESLAGRKDEATIARDQAETAKLLSEANPKPQKPEDLKIVYADAVQDAISRGVDPRQDPQVQQIADVITALQPERAPKEPSQEDRNTREYIDAHKKDFPPDASGNYYIASNMAKARPLAKQEMQAPEKPPRALMTVPQPDGSSKVVEARPGAVIPKGAQTVSEFGKSATPTADEQRRADLSENMNENLDQLEAIVQRSPNLFGPAAGRLTTLRSAVGTSNQDIAALETIKHQIGMAQLGAHSMRSAQGVEKAAESILNGFNNSPEAILAAIQAARNSIKTFSGDVQRKGGDAGPKDMGPANGKAEGSTGKLPDGTKVIVKGGRIVSQ